MPIPELTTEEQAKFTKMTDEIMEPVNKAYEHLAVIAALPAKCAAARLPWSECERLMNEERDKITALKK